MRQVFVFDKNLKKVVRIEERTDKPVMHENARDDLNFQLMPDIEPYHYVVDKELITSRSRHREKLKETGYIEVGNEAPDWMPEFQEEIKREESIKGAKKGN